jgi:propane monooxygenase coupling protein
LAAKADPKGGGVFAAPRRATPPPLRGLPPHAVGRRFASLEQQQRRRPMAQTHHETAANIFQTMQEMTFEKTISDQCGVTMNDSVEARAIAELMETKPGIVVTYMPAMIRIDGKGKIEFRMDEISEVLGREMTPHLFEISTSTHYGRMVMIDDNTVVLFGRMEDAFEYI